MAEAIPAGLALAGSLSSGGAPTSRYLSQNGSAPFSYTPAV